MDKDILEVVLKRHWDMACPKKVLSVESSPAVGKNLNFLSIVERLRIKVVLGNGKVVNKSVIFKKCLDSSEHQYEIFKTEIMIYNTLTQIEYLMEEFDDTEDVLWCKMLHHVPYNLIIMEDLKACGFHMIDRELFFDLDQTLLAVHSFGRYHGMFKILEGRGLSPKGLKPWYLLDSEGMHDCLYHDLINLIKGVKKYWDPSWGPIIDKIKYTVTEVHERLKKFTELDETKFNVTNHGDCLKNNFVMKYNWEKRPISLRFLDFQLAHYGSPCCDLTNMLYLAVDPPVRRDNFDLILRTYHISLINTLDKYHFEGNKPDFEEIKDGMEKYYFLGLFLALTWYPSLMNSNEMDDSENITTTEEDKINKPHDSENIITTKEVDETVKPHNSGSITAKQEEYKMDKPQDSESITTSEEEDETNKPHDSENLTTIKEGDETDKPHNSGNITAKQEEYKMDKPQDSESITTSEEEDETNKPHDSENLTTTKEEDETDKPHNSGSITAKQKEYKMDTPQDSESITSEEEDETNKPHDSENLTTTKEEDETDKPHNSGSITAKQKEYKMDTPHDSKKSISETEEEEVFDDESYFSDLLENKIGSDIKAFVERFCSNN